MACDSLVNFATATENLGMELLRVPADSDVFNGAITKGTYDRNKGVTKTVFTLKHTEPSVDDPPFTTYTLDGSNQPTPSCNPSFTDVPVDFYSRTYSPKVLNLRGPEICREKLDFIHNPGEFVNGYVNEIGRASKRIMEFGFREDYLYFSDVFVDPAFGGPGKYVGPNAWGVTGVQTPFNTGAAFPVPLSDLTQDSLDLVADDLINVGATEPDSNGYIQNGGEGPVFTLLVNRIRSSLILKNNSERRNDARFQHMGGEQSGDLALWSRINAGRVIGNFRHVPCGNMPRANVVGGKLQRVNTYKDVTAVGTDGIQYTNEYLTATHECAIALLPSVFTAEIVIPYTWEFPDPVNYMGEWDFLVGGERIDSGCYDPYHDRGRHFGRIKYAPKPMFPYHGKVVWYKRCSNITQYAYC
jgi:hypothetical protein